MSLIRISESDNWIVDYETDSKTYRVSYFEEGHFVDQCRFEPYEAKEVSMQQALSDHEYKVFKESINPENVTFEDIKAAIDEFNRMCAESAKSDKDLYEEQMVKMLTNWDKQ